MDEVVFSQYLQKRGFSEAVIAQHVQAISAFEEYCRELLPPFELEEATQAVTQNYVDFLINSGSNSFENLVALARYGYAIHHENLIISILELLDGAEAYENLVRRVGEILGEEVKEQVFADLPIPPLGLSNQEKANLMRTSMQRLEDYQNLDNYAQLFAISFRDLADEYYLEDKQKYQEFNHFDQYLMHKRESFIKELESCRETGRLFFSQSIDQSVIDFVRSDPEIESGIRQGNILYVSKIPYMTKDYLEATDPRLKRYFACHCPWARESILQAEGPVPAEFCKCSAGFHKKSLEVIFEQPLHAEVLESVLQGDLRCRFAIYLPDKRITSTR
jgi:hypothetical protein